MPPSALSADHIESIRAIVGADAVRIDAQCDGLDPGFHPANLDARLITRPNNVESISALMAFCNAQGIAVVPHGGRTGLAMGAESSVGQLILDTSRLQSIDHIDPLGGTAVVGAGVTLQALDNAAEEFGLSAGIDLGARGTATIGGMVSTNAGGIEAFRNGVMRHRVLGLEAVLADGRILSDLKQVTKANEGYDVRQLFIGAEGTLGIVTRIVVSLLPREDHRMTALASCASVASAVNAFRRLHNRRDGRLLSAELMLPLYSRSAATQLNRESVLAFEPDPDAAFVLFEVANQNGNGERFLEELLGECVESGELTNAVIAKNERERNDMWHLREESFAAEAHYPYQLWFDVSVPLEHLQNYFYGVESELAALDPGIVMFGIAHIGDGNVHISVASMQPLDALGDAIRDIHYRPLPAMNGSFSAEHGIGTEKREALERYGCPVKRAIMVAIKKALDPNAIMNPGKVLQETQHLDQ